MDHSRYVIAGGGMVAGYAAQRFVEAGAKAGELAIFSADTALPYERPPLSKGFLAGRDAEDGLRINPGAFYADHGIEVRLGTRVAAVDARRRRLTLASGAEFGFDRLMIATGSQVRTLDVPGAGLANVQYLRSLDDSKAIRQRAQGAKRAVVAGGGFIGMEVAAVLAQQGLEVTMVLRETRIWERFFSAPMSAFFEGYYAERGVRIVKAAAIQELRGDGTVAAVVLADGRSIGCDLVVAGVGVRPATEFLAGSGVETADGVMVNEYLETNLPDIFAAGDIANYPDLIFHKRRRVEHWDNAVAQGQHCARVMTGDRIPFRHVPYFFSDVFDLSYEFWGDPTGAGEVVYRGDTAGSSFSAWWLRESAVVAAFVMRRPDEEREAAPKWIEAGQRVSAEKLADESAALAGAVLPA